MTRDLTMSELRLINPLSRLLLAQLLDQGDGWKDLVSVLKDPFEPEKSLLNSSQMSTLTTQLAVSSPTQSLLDYWSTSGTKHNRPTISLLIDKLREAKLHRAADQMVITLKLDKTNTGTDTPTLNQLESLEPSAPLMSFSLVKPVIPEPELEDEEEEGEIVDGVRHIPFKIVKLATNYFNDIEVDKGGNLAGKGGFATVYKGSISSHVLGQHESLQDRVEVAIKVMNKETEAEEKRQFLNEISVLCQLNHRNLLSLLAVSQDGPSLCLVYPFAPLGSLNQCLKNGFIDYGPDRMNILLGVARALNHLHTFLAKPLIHRDVKSDNILMESDLTPKLGDFGLTRQGPLSSHGSGQSMVTNVMMTQRTMGTNGYMGLDAYSGIISVKLDTFAFGVVMMEVLTGLAPIFRDREEDVVLYDHVQETFADNDAHSAIEKLLDTNVKGWDWEMVEKLFNLSIKSTPQNRKLRPLMSVVYNEIKNMLGSTEPD